MTRSACTIKEGSKLDFETAAIDFADHVGAVTDEPLISVLITVTLEGHRYQLPAWSLDPAAMNDVISMMTLQMGQAVASKQRYLASLPPRRLPDGLVTAP